MQSSVIFRLLFISIMSLAFHIANCQTYSSFKSALESQPEISNISELTNDIFPEKYAMSVRQSLDWTSPSSEKFDERVIVGFRGYDRPTVIVTEGYFAHYALNPRYEEELSRMFDANLIVCEYRYFGESVPSVNSWDYLTVDNSLADLHHVRDIFGRLFKGKWISTGISKGGQTTMFYRATYPDDVDVSVSYVAPLNRGIEDGRHEPFLNDKVGTSEERSEILSCQRELLSRKSRLLPRFEMYAKLHSYTYQAPISEIYDYCVLELPFALWQWGTPVHDIPSSSASDDDWFSFFTKISEPDYFSSPSDFTPFFVQAARELGYYGYSLKGLKDLSSLKSSRGYLHRLMLPSDARLIKFDKRLYKRTVKYLKKSDPRHIFIYGEIDPWSSSGVLGWLDCSKKKNMRIFVKPRGSHTSRIGNMPDDIKSEIVSLLTKWLEK